VVAAHRAVANWPHTMELQLPLHCAAYNLGGVATSSWGDASCECTDTLRGWQFLLKSPTLLRSLLLSLVLSLCLAFSLLVQALVVVVVFL
jgi:hypothetical protein